MAQRTVIWTRTASIQLREILGFWLRRTGSSVFSNKLLDKVEQHIEWISTFPFHCPESLYSNHRISAMGHYSIIYQVTDHEIWVTAFWDNRRDPQELINVIRKSNNTK